MEDYSVQRKNCLSLVRTNRVNAPSVRQQYNQACTLAGKRETQPIGAT